MMEKLGERIAEMQTRRPLLFLLVFFIITISLLPGLLLLKDNVEPSLEKVLPQKINELREMNNLRTMFRSDMMYLLVESQIPVEDIRSPQVLEYVDQLSSKIEEREYIYQTQNLAQLVKKNNEGEVPSSIHEVKSILDESNNADQYINEDYSMTVIKVRSDTGASADLIQQVVNAVEEDIRSLENQDPGTKVQVTGFNAIDKATYDVIISDFILITFISLVFVGGVVLITFRRIGRAMLPLTVVASAVMWTLGIVGYLGLQITVVSMVAAAMIMGLGIDFGIHVVHLFKERRKKYRRKIALKETMKELLRALVGASSTTIAGFLALLFGVMSAMKVLGIILAIGIFSTLIGAVFLLPVLVYLHDVKTGGAK